MKMTSEDLLQYFIKLAPSFQQQWESEDNYSIDDNGDFSFHDVCTEFSHYYRDQKRFKEDTLVEKKWHPDMTFSEIKELFNFIEDHLVEDERMTDELDNALCTCFLENIAQTNSGDYSLQFMGEKTKQYFEKWNV